MANFGKIVGQDTKGWTASSSAQTLDVGANVEIGLWGGAPDGSELQVAPTDRSVCTVHERLRPGLPNWRAFVITALREGDTEIAATLPGARSAFASMRVHVVNAGAGIRLVFFPGERNAGGTVLGTIYVVGDTGQSFSAAGGPRTLAADRGHTAEPTPAGRYTLGPKHRHRTPNWPYSAIPYGAPLRLTATKEVEYQGSAGGWIAATGPTGVVTMAVTHALQRAGIKPDRATVEAEVRRMFFDAAGNLKFTVWKLNDFGPWSWNLVRKGKPTAYYIHTTPDDEDATSAGYTVSLVNSHGCIHIRPVDRNKMEAAGYLKQGIEFEVRPYSESGPP